VVVVAVAVEVVVGKECAEKVAADMEVEPSVADVVPAAAVVVVVVVVEGALHSTG